jgi:hypothetical protein
MLPYPITLVSLVELFKREELQKILQVYFFFFYFGEQNFMLLTAKITDEQDDHKDGR